MKNFLRNLCTYPCTCAILIGMFPSSVNLVYAVDVINTHDAQVFQKDFDEKYFEINHDFEKLRHILLHLVKTTGKLASFCEIMEHAKIEPNPSVLVDEVLPDLLIHALQIANIYQVDLGEKYAERIRFIINRSEPTINERFQ